MKDNPPVRKRDGWQWDPEGNRIKKKSTLSDTVKKPTLNNSLTVNKVEVHSSFAPELAIKYQIYTNADGTIILTNRGMLPKKAPLLARFNTIKDIKDYRFIEREVAARAFCDRGYGIPMLRAEIT